MGKKKFKAIDILIFALYAAVLFLSFFLLSPKGSYLTVNANGKEYIYNLEDEGVFEVEGALGKTIFEIKDGKVRFIDSPCSGKTCIYQGFSDMVICLPNKVIATSSAEEGGVDATSI